MSDKKNTQGLRVAILATDGVEDAELKDPRKALDEAGAKTTLIAPKAGKIQSFNHSDKASQYNVDKTLDQVRADQFDAVLLPGGAMNADTIRVHPRAQEFVREMNQAGKPIAFICHAPWLLVSAGLVKGRSITSYHTIQDDIRNAGGKWQDAEVVQDKNWVSSRQPSDIPAFNRSMIELFAEQSSGQEKTGTQGERRVA
jgi:protease I